MSHAVIDVNDLGVIYRTGFRRKRVPAVRGASFDVRRGEIFGFIGPNGAGKTTTMRVLMGLIRATSGSCTIFGQPIPSRDARRRLGFLPESPYFYDYLDVRELIDLTGRLFGLDRQARARRADELIALVGLEHALDKPMRKYSKGMLQRAGIAQALVNDPELVVFDEPMSGLDPIGRKEVRDVILSLRDRGKTVFFSTHILPDVEMVCDRVAFIVNGEVRGVGSLAEVAGASVLGTDLAFRIAGELTDEALAKLEARAVSARRRDRDVFVSLHADTDVDDVLALARELGLSVVSVATRHHTLEDVFLETAAEGESPEGATS
jgi:ABC-2 type transport system ATP-binding protein